MNIRFSKKQIENAIAETVSRNGYKEDVYIRPLVYRGGIWRMPNTPIDIVVFVVPTPRSERLNRMREGVKCCVSSWRRLPDEAMPAREKPAATMSTAALLQWKLRTQDSMAQYS